MIGRIRGTLIEKHPPHLVVDVRGVGYELEAPMTTFYKLPRNNEEVSLYTHLVVRDDAHLLYGFASERERRLFRSLLKINGVGARVALAILSGMEADQFVACIEAGDTARLVRLPGIGKKTAERLMVEMRDRLRNWAGESISATGDPAGPEPAAEEPVADAVSALITLGYKTQEASRYVHAVAAEGMTREAIIREALRALVKG
jgi:Holliday junction DNA helicase RuvA